MSFLFPTLLWIGLPLLAGPILLHLLNLRRQRRVEWAAMDFLLESEQRNKNWINLRQWLLLAARLAAVLLVVLMLAQPRVVGSLATWLTAERVHHVVVLDDSYSMSQQTAVSSTWEAAIASVDRVLAAAAKTRLQRVTIVRTSRAGAEQPGSTEQPSGSGPEELTSLRERIGAWTPTQSAAELSAGITAASRVVEVAAQDGPVVVYLVSDFRAKDVEPAEAITGGLAEVAANADAVHLIPCGSAAGANLTISDLRLLPGAKSAGLELTGLVTVTNRGDRAAERVTVQLQRDDRLLPAADLGDIAPRSSATRRFPVRFGEPGGHALVATLEPDAIDADNRRYFAASLPDERRVLVVDGSPGGHEGLAYSAALSPAGVKTGWRPVRVAAGRMDRIGSLDAYAAVLLLDVPRFSPSAATALREYSRSGGGVLLSLGASVDRRNYNRLIFGASDEALLPIELDLPTQTARTDAAAAGDLVVGDHPLFRVFAGDRNSFLQLLAVNYHHTIAPLDEAASAARTIARLQSGEPLVIEGTAVEGRTICLLTSATRPLDAVEGWSNLGVSPVFPVLVNELVAHLAAPRLEEPGLVVGDAWSRVVGAMNGEGLRIESATPGNQGTPLAAGSGAERQGVVRVTPLGPASTAALVAVNVDPREGDLAGPTVEELRDTFSADKVEITTPGQLLRSEQDDSQAGLGRLLAGAVLALLLAEKFLAIACSYHQPAPARGAA